MSEKTNTPKPARKLAGAALKAKQKKLNAEAETFNAEAETSSTGIEVINVNDANKIISPLADDSQVQPLPDVNNPAPQSPVNTTEFNSSNSGYTGEQIDKSLHENLGKNAETEKDEEKQLNAKGFIPVELELEKPANPYPVSVKKKSHFHEIEAVDDKGHKRFFSVVAWKQLEAKDEKGNITHSGWKQKAATPPELLRLNK